LSEGTDGTEQEKAKDSVTVSRMFTGQDDKGPLQDEVRDISRIEAQRIHFRTKSGIPLG